MNEFTVERLPDGSYTLVSGVTRLCGQCMRMESVIHADGRFLRLIYWMDGYPVMHKG